MLNSQEFQQGIQAQQLISNAGQQAMTNKTQGRVGDDGRERAQVLSAAQIADQQKSGHVAMAILASKGQDSEMARMSDPNYAAAKMASVAQQSRLKGLA
jgi:hypothetical protein